MKLWNCFMVREGDEKSVDAQGLQAGAGAGFVLLGRAAGDADATDARAVLDDGQAAAEQDQPLALVQADAQQLVVADDAAPLRRGKAEARGRVGLVDRDVDRMQKGMGHAQEGGEDARCIGHGHVDAYAQCFCVRNGSLASQRSRRRGDHGRGNRECG
jgi:hypothetical protein